MTAIRRVAVEERVPADPTAGQAREVAITTERMWCGVVTAPAGEQTPWHHHGDHTTVAYVLEGLKRLEFGPAGEHVVEAEPGDFLLIPRGTVHRESTLPVLGTRTVAFRLGSGPTTIASEAPAAGEPISRIRPEDRVAGDPTAGMVREAAVEGGGVWAGFVRTSAGSVSGWHHHGEHETAIHLLEGAMTVEWEDGSVTLAPGEFCFVPPGIVHRESNPSGVESRAVVVRTGIGPPTTNVDAPGRRGIPELQPGVSSIQATGQKGARAMKEDLKDLKGKMPPEVEEKLDQAVQTFKENHRNPTNLALHGLGYYAILKGVVRFLRHKRFRGLAAIAVGVGLILAGHEIEGTPPFALLKSGNGTVK